MDDSPKQQLQSDCLCGRDHIKAGDASHVAADFDARLSQRPAWVVFVTTECIIDTCQTLNYLCKLPLIDAFGHFAAHHGHSLRKGS